MICPVFWFLGLKFFKFANFKNLVGCIIRTLSDVMTNAPHFEFSPKFLYNKPFLSLGTDHVARFSQTAF